MLWRAPRDDGRLLQNARIGQSDEGAGLAAQIENRCALFPLARYGRDAFYGFTHLVKAHFLRIEANRAVALPHAEGLVHRVVSGNRAADSEAQRNEGAQKQGANADSKIASLLGHDRPPCQRRPQPIARYRARPTWREADVAIALPECRQRRDAPYLAGHHGNAYHEGRQEGSTAAKAHPRKGCLNHEDSRDEQEHRPEERLQKAARDEAEDEANERDERILHDEGPTERIARKPHPFQEAPVGIAALYVRGRRVQAQDEGYHKQDEREHGKHRGDDLHHQKTVASESLPGEKRVRGFAPRGPIVDQLRQIAPVDALGARLGRQHHVDLPNGIRFLLHEHGTAGGTGAGCARLLNFRQQLIEGSGRQQVALRLHERRPHLRIFIKRRDAQRGLPSADIEHQVIAYLYVVQGALRNADVGLAVRRPALIVAI